MERSQEAQDADGLGRPVSGQYGATEPGRRLRPTERGADHAEGGNEDPPVALFVLRAPELKNKNTEVFSIFAIFLRSDLKLRQLEESSI